MERQSKKQKKIFRKIFLPIVHILLIFAVATSVVSYFLVDRFVKENARQKVEEAYNDVQNQLNAFEASGEKTFTLLPSDNLINQSNNTRVYVYDKDFTEIALFDNTIYIDSEMTDFISELLSNFELDENVLTTIRFNNREYLANTYVASDRLDIKEKYFVVVQDLTDKAVLLRTNMRNMLIVQFIVLLITIITSFIVARDLSRPLIKLSKESEDYVIGKGITIDDELIKIKPLDRDACIALIDECKEKGFAWGFTPDDSRRRLIPDERFLEETHDEYMESVIVEGLDPRDYEEFYKVYVACSYPDENKLESLSRLPWCRYHDEYFFVEPTDKSVGIVRMMDHLKAPLSDAVVFGDGLNDLTMFRPEWTSIAMGNGADEIKEKATYVTDSAEDDGIYNACRHFEWI